MTYPSPDAEGDGVLPHVWSRIRSHTMWILRPVCEIRNHHGYLSGILRALSRAHSLSLSIYLYIYLNFLCYAQDRS